MSRILDAFAAIPTLVGGVIFFGLLGLGYVQNIITLFGAESIGGEQIIRAIGIIVAPLGIIMGYI